MASSAVQPYYKVLTSVPAPFAGAVTQPSGPDSSIRLPQTIAHRGYKAAYPENTLRSFSAAVDIGAHAVETDIHLSRDKVVVLSHVSDERSSVAPIFAGGKNKLRPRLKTNYDSADKRHIYTRTPRSPAASE